MKEVRNWLLALDELFFPRPLECVFCGERPGTNLGPCRTCLDSLAIAWQRMEVQGYPCFSLVPYRGFARDLIHKMKYHGGYRIAQGFSRLLGLALREELSVSRSGLLVPVPLHASRLEKRGFNHAALLADGISKVWRLPVSSRVVRVRPTKPQSGLTASQRRRNLRGAFALVPGENWQGRQIVIVDDVITSGYTFSTVADLAAAQGGRPLGVFVARTEMDGGGKDSVEKLQTV